MSSQQPPGEMARRYVDLYLPGLPRPTFAIGPVVWAIEPGHDMRHWYFTIAVGSDGSGTFSFDSLRTRENDPSTVTEVRAALLAELARREVVAVSSFDDELKMLRYVDTAFPGEKARELLVASERERRG